MAVAANKRSVMTLFSGSTDISSHQVRIVLAEKGVGIQIEDVNLDNPPQDLRDLNPSCTVPTLVERDLTLYPSLNILEYLDERYPHPPLMPVYPIARARSRLLMHGIKNDWYSLQTKIEQANTQEATAARQQLSEALLEIAPTFKTFSYFMSHEFSLVDCFLAPLLWRLKVLEVDNLLNCKESAKELKSYMSRVFERESFLASLTEPEREMRPKG
ncbi:stringent starvation protein SspA [Candidatus Fukatsuia symbiotica]|uniref:Stringent starvation protein A n=1 Tax=Candidatus Fukatsuia symbiotica TaxID=1878942 RepID=A0A2U8I7U6_9GAMM|nr:stringent starvation protein SspA [Candidatus Fukatsuia symbiotica]AWK15173.1 stringent starvation protein A [Candidatus Fukatsuia symbiotica]MEA9443999.1 stringent starvation protein SspA [Candidatus Fukatsuia symbiotica]